MKTLEIFEPSMCCSSGVCGPGVDPELLRISTAVNNLDKKGYKVKRYNLTSNPQEFVTNVKINSVLTENGSENLPVTMLEGEIVKKGAYPTNEELVCWLNIEQEALDSQKDDESKCGGSGCC